MSITDPVIVTKHKKWGWMLLRGPETFYDENRHMITFDSKEEAIKWATTVLKIPLEELIVEN